MDSDNGPRCTAQRLGRKPYGPVIAMTPAPTNWWNGGGTRPVLALDVDGVVNCFPRNLAAGPRTTDWRVHIPVERQRRTAYHAGFGLVAYDADLRIPDRVQRDLEYIEERCDMVWCTTWEAQAPEVIAPALGVGHDWPVLDLAPAPVRFELSHNSSGAKAARLEAVMTKAGTVRPTLWVDDRPEPQWLAGNALGGLGSAVRTNPEWGWTDATFAAVMEWLGRVAQP